jgi:ABC-type dipeptide/oligopeptide/nickel transport system ATPase component
MNRVFRYAFWKIKAPKSIALVGKSGTGKSFRSKIIAEKYHCQLIIDDGLLIKGDRILAGRSQNAPKANARSRGTAVFDETSTVPKWWRR